MAKHVTKVIRGSGATASPEHTWDLLDLTISIWTGRTLDLISSPSPLVKKITNVSKHKIMVNTKSYFLIHFGNATFQAGLHICQREGRLLFYGSKRNIFY